MKRATAGRPVLAAALTAVVLSVVLPGQQQQVPASGDSRVPVASDRPAVTEESAVRAAKSAGEPVEVTSQRSERREVFAQPDGSFVAREYAEPIHTVRDGRWVEVDETLVRRADGSWGPKAATVDLAFRAAEAGEPFVTLRRAGRELSLSWPYSDLQTPTVEGDAATFPEVLPGVDLTVRAEADGFGHLLVVKTPEAAANPQLKTIDLGLSTKGLNLAENAAGALVAEDAAVGGAVFEAGRPAMWDSSAQTELAAKSGGAAGVASSLDAAVRSGEPVAEPRLEGPGGGGRTAPLGVEVGGDKLTLTPDMALLTGKETVFPVVIDPIQRTTSRTAWTGVMSGIPGEQDWKYSGSAGVGKCPTDYSPVSCNGVGVRRLLFTMPVSFYRGKQILGATFSARVEHIYSAKPTAEPIQLYRIGGKNYSITSSSDWNSTKDDWSDYLQTVDKAISPTSCTSQANLHFEGGASGELTSEVKTAAAEGWSSMTLGLRAGDESQFAGWKRICGNAYLSVSYNNLPRQMSTKTMSSDPGGSCKWGSSRPYAEKPPKLSAVASDPDHGDGRTDKVKVQFKVAWTAPGASSETSYTYDTSYMAPTSNTRFTHQVRESIPQNVVIYWSARAYDGDGWGPWSTDGDPQRCEFIYDKTKPGKPNVISAQYPADTVWHDGVGTAGTFTFSPNPNDSVPDTDVVKYRYGFNSDASPATTIVASKAGGPASVTFTPTRAGRNWVDVVAVDKAENPSTLARYEFLVTEGRPAVAQWNLADEAGDSDAHDESGTFSAGTGPGVTFGVEGPGGKADAAARLDGTSGAYLDAGETVIDTSQSFSVSAWVRPTALDKDMTVVSQDGTGEPGFTLGYDAAAGTWAFSLPSTDVQALGKWKAVATGVTPVKGQWMLLTGVYDAYASGGPQARIYINKDSKGTAQRRSVWRSYGPLQIGRATAKSGYRDHFTGDLAEVRVFDRVLPASQVAELMTVKPQRNGYWQLDSATGTASAETGGGQALNLVGDASIYRPADPLFDTAALVGDGHLVLDGAGDYASTSSATVYGNSSFTISARAQLTSLNPEKTQTVFSIPGYTTNRLAVRYRPAADASTPAMWELVVPETDSSTATVQTYVDDQELPSGEGSGQHLAVVYDAFANDIRLYVEGQLASTAHGANDTLWATNSGLQVGRTVFNSSQNFAGAIDEVRVYNGALDPAAVRKAAQLTALPDM
ncbi:LamG domain-containing protein [Streptomyces sp. NPDC091046]|uniref:LamG domain-containing protein n=1 Tax=Streptomyces sp. NPDC091046 TaxID=3365973 RepID=UPI0037F330C1